MVNAGSSTTSGPISVTASNGFTGTINLTCALTSGTGSCSVSPSSVTSIPTTASVTVNATSLSAGSYQMVVQGISGTTTHTLQIPFNVGDFQVTGPQSLTLGPGTQGMANLTVAASTFYSGNVTSTCSVSSLPGTTCTVSPSPTVVSVGSTVQLVATINIANNAAPGTYNVSVNVQDSSGIPSHSLVFPLTVQDFALNTSTSSQTVAAGGTTGGYNLTVSPVGAAFANPVTLSCSGLPPGAQCSFSPNPVTPGATSVAAILTISTAATTPAGTSMVTVTGVSGALSRSSDRVAHCDESRRRQRRFSTCSDPAFPSQRRCRITADCQSVGDAQLQQLVERQLRRGRDTRGELLSLADLDSDDCEHGIDARHFC